MNELYDFVEEANVAAETSIDHFKNLQYMCKGNASRLDASEQTLVRLTPLARTVELTTSLTAAVETLKVARRAYDKSQMSWSTLIRHMEFAHVPALRQTDIDAEWKKTTEDNHNSEQNLKTNMGRERIDRRTLATNALATRALKIVHNIHFKPNACDTMAAFVKNKITEIKKNENDIKNMEKSAMTDDRDAYRLTVVAIIAVTDFKDRYQAMHIYEPSKELHRY